jgi:hypothetical protein
MKNTDRKSLKILEDSHRYGGEGEGRNNIKVDLKNVVCEAAD